MVTTAELGVEQDRVGRRHVADEDALDAVEPSGQAGSALLTCRRRPGAIVSMASLPTIGKHNGNLTADRGIATMRYWVYENWTAEDKAVVHRAVCGFCKDGQGTGKGFLGEKNGRWHGPFASAEAALSAARTTGREVRRCSFCMRRTTSQMAKKAKSPGKTRTRKAKNANSNGSGTPPRFRGHARSDHHRESEGAGVWPLTPCQPARRRC